MAKKKKSEQPYATFKERHHAASVQLDRRNEAMSPIVVKGLKKDLELPCLAGVEDKSRARWNF